jgi:hypothetical protein
MGHLHRDLHAVRGHPAPALREVPEQRQQPAVDAVELRDGLHERQPLQALGEAVDEHRVHLGELDQRAAEAAVQHGEPRLLEHRPAHAERDELGRAARLPRAHDVARAEQLARDVVGERQLARHQAVHDHQPDVLRPRVAEPLAVPRPPRDGVRPDQEVPPGLLEAGSVEEPSQVRFRVEQGDRARICHLPDRP